MATRKGRIRIAAASLALAQALSSCSMWAQDEGLSSLEDDYIQEQTSIAISVEEGGVVYSVETLSDPAIYEELESTASDPDPDTGYRSVSWTLDLPYVDASTVASMNYRLYDENGDVQSAFDSSTRVVEASLSYDRSVEAVRYSAITAQQARLRLEGLNTPSVVANGEFTFQRDCSTTPGMAFQCASGFDANGTLSDIALSYDDDYGRYVLDGGSAALSMSGSVNKRSFSRYVSWSFGEGYEATMHYEGETVTVDIETGAEKE